MERRRSSGNGASDYTSHRNLSSLCIGERRFASQYPIGAGSIHNEAHMLRQKRISIIRTLHSEIGYAGTKVDWNTMDIVEKQGVCVCIAYISQQFVNRIGSLFQESTQ